MTEARYTVFTLILTMTLSFLIPSTAHAKRAPHPLWREMHAIESSGSLSRTEKVEKFKTYLNRKDAFLMALNFIDRVDSPTARSLAREIFHKKGTSRLHRLHLGEFLLRHRWREQALTPEEYDLFLLEYRDFLIEAILDDGEAVFNRPHTGHPTAIGALTCIAGGIGGLRHLPFEPFADKRLIPILVRSLSAPDHIWAKDQGCVRRGTPGEPTGRNTQRQGLPLALAKLGAVEAMPALAWVIATHPDYYLRSNAAYALWVLSTEKTVNQAETWVRQGPKRRLLYDFARGLLDRGNLNGLPYFHAPYSVYFHDHRINGTLYMIEQRHNLLKKLDDPRIGAYYRSLLDHAPFRNILLHNAEAFKEFERPHTETAEQQLTRWNHRTVTLYRALLDRLRQYDLQDAAQQIWLIRKGTQNETIREMSEAYLKTVAGEGGQP
ncbi:MAG: hypothetical protein ACYTGH_05480 [Planctomycetota bacterium]|jgi:hypothetical protein